MNRKKKISQIIVKRRKQAQAKKTPSTKPRYISKAERAKIAALEEAGGLTEEQVENQAENMSAGESAESLVAVEKAE